LRQLASRKGNAGAALRTVDAHLATALAELGQASARASADAWAAAATRWLELDQTADFAYARLMEAQARLSVGGARAEATDAIRTAHSAARVLGARLIRERSEALAAQAGISLTAGDAEPSPRLADRAT
jgi:DNA-binding SARP family transcriptional activator